MTSPEIAISISSALAAGPSGAIDRSSDYCHGFWYSFMLIVPSSIFVVYLAINARKNLKKLSHVRWHAVMISYYALLWFATALNLTWCCLQAWQCIPEKEVSWNLLSLLSTSTMLCLEMSLLGFLLQENYTTGLDSLARTFTISGFAVSMDALLKAICVFGFHVPLFVDIATTNHAAKWALWVVHKLLVTVVYGYILFVHYSKWREKLPPRSAFYRYVVIMFILNVVTALACVLAGLGVSLGHWLYDLAAVCYHSLYPPFLYATFLADFFQEEELLLDDAYYSEMRDAGFFDEDWE